MAIVPDDELCIQQMLGIVEIPEDILEEYMIRARMFHRQLSGGAIGPVAIVDMLRALGYGPLPPQATNDEGNADWRLVERDTRVDIRIDGKWISDPGITFQGEVGGGTVAVNNRGRIDEFNSYDVQIPARVLPADVNAESFEGEADKAVPDARASLIEDDGDEEEWSPELAEDLPGAETVPAESTDELSEEPVENEVEKPEFKGDIGKDDEIPSNVEQKIRWGRVKRGTELWLRDGDDMKDCQFHRCVAPDRALVLVDGESEPREVERAFLKMP